MKKQRFASKATTFLLFCIAFTISLSAQTFTSLASFDGTDGAEPWSSSVVQGTDGNFYGTTFFGGTSTSKACNGCGTVFRMTPGGTLTTIHNFCSKANCADGWEPLAGVILGTDGNFYGTTMSGGAYGEGTVFKVTPDGFLTTLHSFAGSDGQDPQSGLVQGEDGNFYGVTWGGGIGAYGVVFKITSTGQFTVLHQFCSFPNCGDGFQPQDSLIQGTDGNFYGTTYHGGASFDGPGTVFRVSPTGEFSVLHQFCAQWSCADGAAPSASLVQATNGNFYGTTQRGGIMTSCNPFGCGTIFEITLAGQFTTLHDFCSEAHCDDGTKPYGGLTQGSDGNLYGITSTGGQRGEMFRLTQDGSFTALTHLCQQTGCPDGTAALAGMIQSTNGSFYGTTNGGGDSSACSSCGTVYSLSVGLAPFVEALPNTGRVGKVIGILGNHLTGATSVTFNGVAASFTVVSDTLIKATLPTAAATGSIQVTTPAGTLSSNIAFQLLP